MTLDELIAEFKRLDLIVTGRGRAYEVITARQLSCAREIVDRVEAASGSNQVDQSNVHTHTEGGS